MAVDSDDVIAYEPAAASIDEERIDLFIGYAETQVNRDVWGDLADQAVILLTLHGLYTTGPSSGASSGQGPVTSEKVGDLQRSYASPASGAYSDSTLARTGYGQEYLRLRKTLVFTPMVVC